MTEGKIVYIASPYAGDIEGNIKFAKAACLLAMEHGSTPVAAHLLYPQMLDDAVPEQRELGLKMGLRLLGACDELWLCGSRISNGMQEELKSAGKLGIPVRRIPEDMVAEFMQPETDMEQHLSVQRGVPENPVMAMGCL